MVKSIVLLCEECWLRNTGGRKKKMGEGGKMGGSLSVGCCWDDGSRLVAFLGGGLDYLG